MAPEKNGYIHRQVYGNFSSNESLDSLIII